MAQARRKAPAKSKTGKSGGYVAGLVMLLAGMAIGSLATILWQGTQTTDSGIGAGIRRLTESANQPQSSAEKTTDAQPAQPVNQSTPFTFFTFLPEIEVVVPTRESAAAATSKPAAAATSKPAAAATSKPAAAAAAKAAPEQSPSTFMLQAASYQNQADADRLKATLALSGMVSVIQKVSVEGRGDFFRVRLGPYASYAEMVAAEQPLIAAGIKALRLKMHKAG